MNEPTKPAEWQEAVDLANWWLLVDSARKYGLITGAPEIDVDRCERILADGKARGFEPTQPAEESA